MRPKDASQRRLQCRGDYVMIHDTMPKPPPQSYACLERPPVQPVVQVDSSLFQLGGETILPVNRAFTHALRSSDTELAPLEFLTSNFAGSPETLAERQALVAEFHALTRDGTAYSLFEASQAFGKKHHWLLAYVHDPVLSSPGNPVFTPRIEQLRRDGLAETHVQELAGYRKVSQEASTLLSNQDAYPLVAAAACKQQNIFTGAVDLDIEEYICTGGCGLPDAQQQLLDSAQRHYIPAANADLLARTIAKLPLTAMATDKSEIAINGLWQPRFERNSQDSLNITVKPGKPVAITGKNGSGKTFLTEGLAAAAIMTSSTGYSAANGNIPLLSAIISLSRPNSGGDRVSTFDKEIAQWSEVARIVEEIRADSPNANMLIVADEPFSGTSFEGQKELIARIAEGLGKRGVMLVFTTHADVSDMSGVKAYKIDKKKGRRVLNKGVGDSEAFRAAEEMGFNPDIRTRAEELADGAELDFSNVQEPPPHFASRREIYAAHKRPLGLAWFKNHEAPEPQEEWRRYDPDQARRNFYKSVPPYEVNRIIGNDEIFWQYSHPQGVLHGYAFGDRDPHTRRYRGNDGGTVDMDILLARQEFFCNMADYPESSVLKNDLQYLKTLTLALSNNRGVFMDDRIPQALANPLRDVSSTLACLVQSVPEMLDFLPNIIKGKDTKALKFLEQYKHTLNELLKLRTAWDNKKTENTQRNEWIEIPAALRDSFQSLGKLMSKGSVNTPAGKRYPRAFREDVDLVLYDTEYFYNEDSLPKIVKNPRTHIGQHGLNSLYRSLISGDHDSAKGYLQYFVARQKLSINDLSQHAASIEVLYRKTREKAYYNKEPAERALAVLDFVASNRDPLSNISAHFSAIGGEIGDDLAKYVDTNMRAFFDGASRGRAYGERIAKSESESDNAESLLIGEVLGSHHTLATPCSEAGDLFCLVDVARYLRDNNYARWEPSEATSIGGLRNVDHPEYVPADIEAPKGGIDVISGSNMGGKTTLLRGWYANQALAQSIGFVPSGSMKSPLYQHVIFADRPKHDTSKGLSSFGTDTEYWKTIVSTLENAAPSLVFVDEPFSTTASKYQENFILATVEWLAKKGHRVVIATHNHQAIRRLSQAKGKSAVDITLRKFVSTIDEGGAINFPYRLEHGVGASQAIDVARTLGNEALRTLLEE